MRSDLPVYIGNNTIPRLIDYCRQQKFERFLLVADQNTYLAFGNQVERALRSEGFDVVLALLTADEVIANEAFLLQVFLRADREERIFLSVGSGTITDITRFVSHRTRNSFIALPTAASVDGFNSIGAPLVIAGLKKTYLCQPPRAIFADLPTLCSAPHQLSASGFGDMVGKLLSVADWELGHVLMDEPFDPTIKSRSQTAAYRCIEQIEEIGNGSEEGMQVLMEGLIESGFCMLDFANSSPASGAEHHISHLWEMKRLQESKPAILHGVKVGVAAVTTAKWYEEIRKLSREEVSSRLSNTRLPNRDEIVEEIHGIYADNADEIIREQEGYIFITQENFNRLKERIIARWDQVLEIAQAVPKSDELKDYLQQVGAPANCVDIGLSEDEFRLGVKYGHYLRNRFTINKLRLILGID